MKELSIKEKAKRYDEVVNEIKNLRDILLKEGVINENGIICDNFNRIFPELKESEDEKIGKCLLSHFSRYQEDEIFLNCITMKQILAWLEKQGESYTKRDVDDAYLRGVTNTKNEIEKQYEANYQIRKDIATFIFNNKGDIKDRAKWMDYLGIKVSFVEKQGEQKETLCDKCKKEQPSHSCSDITALGRCYLEGEQKPVIEMKSAEESLGIDSDTYNKNVDECIYGEQKAIDDAPLVNSTPATVRTGMINHDGKVVK
jgi:hypothetical protein